MNKVLAFWRDEEGATAIEYGLIAGLIAMALVVTLGALEGNLTGLFDRIGEALEDAGT